MAFLRVQTGVCDPAVLGDKSKWFAHQLEPQPFQAWNACDLDFLRRTLQPSLIGGQNNGGGGGGGVGGLVGSEAHFNSSESESEQESPVSDVERSGSTSSSSYSSLSDLVNELATAEPQHYGKYRSLILTFLNQHFHRQE